MASHQEIERRSLALHAAVAVKLRQDPALIELARERVEGWHREGSVAQAYAVAWRKALEGSVDDLVELLEDSSEWATALRQVSPFAGVLDPRERWEILRAHGLGC